jgi:hypothetical protein
LTLVSASRIQGVRRASRVLSDSAMFIQAVLLASWAARAAQAFVADDFLHAANLWRHFVAAQPSHMRIAPLPIQDRQQPSAEHVDHLRRVGARVGHRTTISLPGEQSRDVKELGKERQRPQSRGASAFVPANTKPPAGGGNPHFHRRLFHFLQGAIDRFDQRLSLKLHLTHRVTLPRRPQTLINAQFAPLLEGSTEENRFNVISHYYEATH